MISCRVVWRVLASFLIALCWQCFVTALPVSSLNELVANATVGFVCMPHVVVIDAGSRGTRAHVFSETCGPFHGMKDTTMKAEPGLATLLSQGVDAAEAIRPLLEFARANVSPKEESTTLLLLVATGGFRELPSGESRSVLARIGRYITETTRFVQPSGFPKLAAGSTEGLMEWTTVNLLAATNGYNADATANIPNIPYKTVLQIGGSSMQLVSLLSSGSSVTQGKQDTSETLQLQRYTVPTQMPLLTASHGELAPHVNVFARSWLRAGLLSARRAYNAHLTASLGHPENEFVTGVIHDPCLPVGFVKAHHRNATDYAGPHSSIVRGTGVFEECRIVLSRLLTIQTGEECFSQPGVRCGLGGAAIPKIDFSKMLGMGDVFFVSQAVGAITQRGTVSPTTIETMAKKYCSSTWNDLVHRTTIAVRDMDAASQQKEISKLERWCFGAAVVHFVMTRGIGMGPEQEIAVAGKIGNRPIDWAVGLAWLQVSRVKLAPAASPDVVLFRKDVSVMYRQYGDATIYVAPVLLLIFVAAFCLRKIRTDTTAAVHQRHPSPTKFKV